MAVTPSPVLDSPMIPVRPWLPRVLSANAIFCSASGLLIAVAAGPAAAFLGAGTPPILRLVGLTLLAYGLALFALTRRGDGLRQLALVAATLDLGWVAGSAALLLGDWFPLTTAGRWAVIVVAEIVLLFALAQIVGRRSRTG